MAHTEAIDRVLEQCEPNPAVEPTPTSRRSCLALATGRGAPPALGSIAQDAFSEALLTTGRRREGERGHVAQLLRAPRQDAGTRRQTLATTASLCWDAKPGCTAVFHCVYHLRPVCCESCGPGAA